MTGRERSAVSVACSCSTRWVMARRRRSRCRARPLSSSPTSGTTQLAASVGVEARTSATRSSRGVSTSWPIALTTGVTAAATARTSVSLLKASRSSSEPPPRAMTMTSISRSASSSRSAATTWVTACGPCTATSRTAKRTAGHRRRAFSTTSRSAALARPQINPTVRGRNGNGRLRRASSSPSLASTRLRCSIWASSSPTPTGLIASAVSCRVPRFSQNVGRACTTTRAPSTRSAPMASSTRAVAVTESEKSTSVSRRVR